MGTYELGVVGLVGSGVGAVLGAPLLWAGQARRADVRVLGGALLSVAGLAAVISARLAGLFPTSPFVGHTVNTLGLVAFPLAVAYVRIATESAPAFHLALVLPLAAYGVAALVRLGLTGTSVVPFTWLLPVALGFTVAAAVSMWRGRHGAGVLVPPAWIVGFMALVNLAQIARMDTGQVPALRAVVPLVMVLGFGTMVAFVAWRQVAGDTSAATARYERSALDDTAAAALLSAIDGALERDRLFARPDLTLAMLAGAAGSTPHLVSEALNRVGGTSFRDLVTRRRVDDVKAQLASAENDRFTIEGLGAAAGFRSRSALYDAFRRSEGTTPTAYRDAVRRGGDALQNR